MKQIIPYIKKEKNPRAGETITRIGNAPVEYTLVTNKEFNHEKARISSYVKYDDREEYTYYAFNYDIIKDVNDKSIILDYNIEQQYQNIHHFPLPQFLYEYDKSCMVQCDSCKEKFPYDELEYDEVGWNIYTDKRCPKCGEWDCCEVEFQK